MGACAAGCDAGSGLGSGLGEAEGADGVLRLWAWKVRAAGRPGRRSRRYCTTAETEVSRRAAHSRAWR